MCEPTATKSLPLTNKGDEYFNLVNMNTNGRNEVFNRLVQMYSRSYRQQYNEILEDAGVSGRMLLIPSEKLTDFRQKAAQQADQIQETHNRDLRQAIEKALHEDEDIASEQLFIRLRSWEQSRKQWKPTQIALWVEKDAVHDAQVDFFNENDHLKAKSTAIIQPRTAVCEQCQRLIDMETVSIDVVTENPCPVHVNCVHNWVISFGKLEGEQVRSVGIIEQLIRRFLG